MKKNLVIIFFIAALQFGRTTANAQITLEQIYDSAACQLFMVDRFFNSLVLNNTDLPAGTYLYRLLTEKGITGSKMMMVIK